MHGHSSTKLAGTLLAAGAILAGCSEAPNPTAPVVPPSFALGDVTDGPGTAQLGKILVCKSAGSNASGSFTTAIVVNSGTANVSSPATVDPGKCVEVATDPNQDIEPSNFSTFSVTEGAQANTTQNLIACSRKDDQATTDCLNAVNTSAIEVNGFHGYLLTYENIFTPPPTGCTYTKGWYRNNGSSTVIAVDGRTVAEAQAIFNATPGKPGSVTFGGDATLLNLYQQFLAALNNLGGDANANDGPAAVDQAIADVQAGTGGAGTAITTTLTHEQMSALIATLSAFNEGTFTGWPHCAD